MDSLFAHVETLAPDPIFGLTAEFLRDPRQEKVNLSVGVYQTQEGKTPILDVVKQAEHELLQVETTKNYLPIEGDKEYLELASALLFGSSLDREISSRKTQIQTVGGAGALKIGSELIARHLASVIYVPDLTWPNHIGIFSQSGLEVRTYPYAKGRKTGICFEEMKKTLLGLEKGSVILLHAGCHNPSGIDPTKQQWEELLSVFQEKHLVPFFDAAYLGFDRSFEEDAFPIRLFAKKAMEGLFALSFSKNFSLYAERVGMLTVLSHEKKKAAVDSQCKVLVRRNYSNPPLHGAKIVKVVLADGSYRRQWEIELSSMRQRIQTLRFAFVEKLSRYVDVNYLLEGKGLFSFCDFTKEQVERLKKEKGIYMTSDGRINIAGLNEKNIEYVVASIGQLWML